MRGPLHSAARAGKLAAAALAALALTGAASDPAERLPDPAQEAHARALFQQVRCVVCQNESIDDSEADVAHDLRRAIRDQVARGQDDQQIRSYLTARYGEFVLLKPRLNLGNSILWLTPFAVVLAGLGVFAWRARRAPASPPDDLTPEEQARLRQLGGS
jgi:cytochrome c-type biogenesis protein CcmH